MNKKLLKELRDAGFPQTIRLLEEMGYFNWSNITRMADPRIPTLSDLIEAVIDGDDKNSLGLIYNDPQINHEDPNRRWEATYRRVGQEAYILCGGGKTAEEVVARVWLAKKYYETRNKTI